jgi:hypothetical protein
MGPGCAANRPMGPVLYTPPGPIFTEKKNPGVAM